MDENEPENRIAHTDIKEQEEIFLAAFDIIAAVVSIIAIPSRDLTYRNRDVLSLLGYDTAEIDQMTADSRLELFHKDDLLVLEKYYERFYFLNDGEEISVDYRMKNKNGNWGGLSTTGRIFKRDQSGDPIKVLLVTKNTGIPDNKHPQIPLIEGGVSEHALLESEKRFQSIANLVPDLLWDSEPDGSTNWYNDRWLSYTGQSFTQAIGWGWVDAIHPDDRAGSAKRYAEAVAAGRPLRQEHRIRRFDGQYRWFVVNATPLKDQNGLVVKMYGSATDIHDSKQAEEALRKSEEKYRSIFETIDEGFTIQELIIDENDNVTDIVYLEANAGFEKHTGIQDVVGKKASDFVPHLEKHWLESMKYVYKTGRPLRTEGFQSDMNRWMTMQYTRIGNAGSKLLSVVFQDITTQKNIEKTQSFLLRLSDLLRPLQEPEEIQQAAVRLLGEELETAKALYCEIVPDGDTLEITAQYQTDASPTPACIRISDFCGDQPAYYPHGKAVVVCDSENEILGASYQAIGVRSAAFVPLVKSGRFAALFAVSSKVPRNWSVSDLYILEEAAQRTWAATEKAKAEKAKRESEARLAAAFESVPVGLAVLDTAGAVTLANAEYRRFIPSGKIPSRDSENLKKWRAWDKKGALVKPSDFPGARALRGETVVPGLEMLYQDDSGTAIWTRVATTPTFDSDGQVTGLVSVIGDIDMLKRSAEALSQSKDRFRTLADAVPQLIWTNTPDGRADYFNLRWFEYSGLSNEESLGPGWQAIVHPDDAASSGERWHKALSAGKIFDSEYRLRRADGSYRWFIGRNVPLKDSSGNVTGWFGSATDIQDLKATEEALHASRERLRVTMESAVEYAIITTDTEGRIESWNKGAEYIFGYSQSEVTGQSVDIIFTPEDRAADAPQKEMRLASEKGRAEDERWHLRRDGTRFYMSGVVSPIYDEHLIGYVKVARDMTGQKTSEERLRLSEERYRIALQSANMAAWDWSIEKDSIQWNDQHFLLLGLEPEEGPQDSSRFFKYVHPDDITTVKNELMHAVRVTGHYRIEAFRIVRTDGTERWMSGFGRTVAWENGKASRMVGVMFDITQRKVLEQQKEQFIAIASHELRTPVTSIKAYTEMLEELFLEKGDTSSASLMRKMDVQVDRLTSLIYALLDTTRISEGKLLLQKTAFAIDELIIDTIETLKRISTDHYIDTELKADLIVNADQERIRQVLVNLITNAVKYSPGGKRISVRSISDSDKVTISVQDFGIGMDKRTLDQLFEPFYRSPDSGSFSGLGLGLFISAGIVHQHGGTISVESQKGKGAVFFFTIPLQENL